MHTTQELSTTKVHHPLGTMALKRLLGVLTVVLAAVSTSAFAPVRSIGARPVVEKSPATISGTTLFDRRWNFNEGREPWGMKANAEIWNGRVAQMAFTITLLQELITGKGVIQGLQDGNPVNIAFCGGAVLSTIALTIFLAIKGKENDISY